MDGRGSKQKQEPKVVKDKRRTKELKVVMLGDPNVGKSCLLHAYAHVSFLSEYTSTVFDNLSHFDDKKKVAVGLWDTAGSADYDTLRPLAFTDTDVFLICFSLKQPASIENVRNKWVPEIIRYASATPCIIVRCQTDLTEDDHFQEGETMAQELGAAGYVECSAKNDVSHVFDLVVETGLLDNPPIPGEKVGLSVKRAK